MGRNIVQVVARHRLLIFVKLPGVGRGGTIVILLIVSIMSFDIELYQSGLVARSVEREIGIISNLFASPIWVTLALFRLLALNNSTGRQISNANE